MRRVRLTPIEVEALLVLGSTGWTRVGRSQTRTKLDDALDSARRKLSLMHDANTRRLAAIRAEAAE